MAENGWIKQQAFVLAELKRLNSNIEKIFDCIEDLKVNQAVLKVKSGIWGAIGALIPVTIMLIILIIRGAI